jgi:hypothetical protein
MMMDIQRPQDDANAVVAGLLAIEPQRFAEEAGRFAAGLSDRERGILAGALVMAYEGVPDGPTLTGLGLDSADPSLMSRRDVGRLLAAVRERGEDVLRAAIAALHDHPESQQLLGGIFAPSRYAADTGRLGTGREG